MSRVIIDPGHGGTTAVGGSSPFGASAHGCVEKHVTLELARRVAARLGSSAQLTRDRDSNLSLRERAALAARSDAAAFVSIHAGSSARGSELWLHDRHARRSADLAQELRSGLGAVGPARGVFRGPLAVLDPTCGGSAAACLIEVDDLTDAYGRRRLTDPRQLDELAGALAGGVRRYLSRFGDVGGVIGARQVNDAGGLAQRYRGDQNLGSVIFYGCMRPGLDFANRFIWLVWPQRRRPDDAAASVDIDLQIDLFDHDPQQDLNAQPLDTQRTRIQLSEGQRFGYEYTRLPAQTDIYVRIQITDYGQNQDAGQLLWTNGYGGAGGTIGRP